MSAHREAFELYRRAVENMPRRLGDLERAELLDAYSLHAAAIEENGISEEMAWQHEPRISPRGGRRWPP